MLIVPRCKKVHVEVQLLYYSMIYNTDECLNFLKVVWTLMTLVEGGIPPVSQILVTQLICSNFTHSPHLILYKVFSGQLVELPRIQSCNTLVRTWA